MLILFLFVVLYGIIPGQIFYMHTRLVYFVMLKNWQNQLVIRAKWLTTQANIC